MSCCLILLKAAKVKNEDEVYIKLEGINTREAARLLVQKNRFGCPMKIFISMPASLPLSHYLVFILLMKETTLEKYWKLLNNRTNYFVVSTWKVKRP